MLYLCPSLALTRRPSVFSSHTQPFFDLCRHLDSGVKQPGLLSKQFLARFNLASPSTARKRNESCSKSLYPRPLPFVSTVFLALDHERLSTNGSREIRRVDELRELHRFRSPDKMPFCRFSARSRHWNRGEATFHDLSNLLSLH